MVEKAHFTCPRCGRTSFNQQDIANSYCGFCHIFVDDPMYGRRTIELQEIAEREIARVMADKPEDILLPKKAVTELMILAFRRGATWVYESQRGGKV